MLSISVYCALRSNIPKVCDFNGGYCSEMPEGFKCKDVFLVNGLIFFLKKRVDSSILHDPSLPKTLEQYFDQEMHCGTLALTHN